MVLRTAIVSSLVLAVVTACTGKDPYNPGTPLGTFHVVGKLTSNNCDATSEDIPDPWEFDVKLARDGSTLYWIQGDVPVQGTLDAKSHTAMTSSDTEAIESNDAGTGCSMTRVDALDMTVLADPSDTTAVLVAVGTLSYTFSQASGDCSDQLTSAGGGFIAIPCTVGYSITAKRTVAPAK